MACMTLGRLKVKDVLKAEMVHGSEVLADLQTPFKGATVHNLSLKYQ